MKSDITIYKTKDDYDTFQIKKNDEKYFLGNIQNYKSNISELIENFSDIRYDSLVLIFGLDSSGYLENLKDIICDYNKVFIFEPNIQIYEKYKKEFNKNNINLILFSEESANEILSENITNRNYVNIYMSSFGNYEDVYSDEYNKFIEILDYIYIKAAIYRSTGYYFKEIHLKNMLSNINHINTSTQLDCYIDSNKNIPAIIVSAGPSLDKNMIDLINSKNKSNKFFIIAGNRTLGPLIENNIKPDLVVSVDPQEITHKMIENHLNEDVPLVFYEHTNERLVNEYEGNKIYGSRGNFNVIEELKNMIIGYSGGSVAHSSVDIAILLGCNPIILVGQDLAYTYDKDHAQIARVPIDDLSGKNEEIILKDVYGNDIKSSELFRLYKINLENYIKIYTQHENKEFINASYGAHIENTIHRELKEILNDDKYENEKIRLEPKAPIKIDVEAIKKDLLNYINEYIQKCEVNVELCKELIENPKSDEESRIIFGEILNTIDFFVNDKRSSYIGSYIDNFLFEIKEKYFKSKAQEHKILSSNLFYQCSVFSLYFKELKKMLEEIKKLNFNEIN